MTFEQVSQVIENSNSINELSDLVAQLEAAAAILAAS